MLNIRLFSLFLLMLSFGTLVKGMEQKPAREEQEALVPSKIIFGRVPSLVFETLYEVVISNTNIEKANIPNELKQKAFLLKSLLSDAFSDVEKIVLLNLFEDNYNVFSDESFLQKYFSQLMGTVFDKNQELTKVLNSILVKAINHHNKLAAEFAISHGAEQAAVDQALVTAFADKDQEAFTLARNLNAHVSSIENQLINYIKEHDKEHIDFFKAQGFDLNTPLADTLPLIKIITDDSKETVQFLLDEGADPNTRQANFFTPLTSALGRRHLAVIDLLINRGVDVNRPGFARMTPLVLAISLKYPEGIKLLLENQADPNLPTPTGITPLMTAIRSEKPELVNLLLEHGADPLQANKFKKLPLQLAQEIGNEEITNLVTNALEKK